LPARAGFAQAGPSATAGGKLPALLGRARDFYRTSAGASPADTISSALADVARAAYQVLLEHAARSEPSAAEVATVAHITDSVLRPLADRLGRDAAAGGPPAPEPSAPDAPVPELARRAAADATRLRAQLADAAPPELLEAVAALQRIAVDLATDAAAQAAELAELQRGLAPRIMVADDGPYLVTNWASHSRFRRSWHCAGAGSRATSRSATGRARGPGSAAPGIPSGYRTGATRIPACR
jgi:hypothetical protein